MLNFSKRSLQRCTTRLCSSRFTSISRYCFHPSIYNIPQRYKHAQLKIDNKPIARKNELVIPPYITSVQLAELLNMTLGDMARAARNVFDWWPEQTNKRMKKDSYTLIKEIILTFEEATQIAKLYKKTTSLLTLSSTDLVPLSSPQYIRRPPIISILGHKDHGKTTLLDKLRSGNLAEKEEFGITQETYSFYVPITSPDNPKSTTNYTFIDTPGHQNFTEMRENGALFADVILLVIAADEGLLQQSIETLHISKQYKVPVIIVINKIDSPNANVEVIRKELKQMNVKLFDSDHPTVSLKGEMVAVEISARLETNLDTLKKVLTNVTSLLDLQTDINAIPTGTVLECHREHGRGDVLQVILKSGTLVRGDYFVTDIFAGRVKDIRMTSGELVSSVTAGIPVEIMGTYGLSSPAGDFLVCSKEAAHTLATMRRDEFEYTTQPRFQQTEQPSIDEMEQDDDGSWTSTTTSEKVKVASKPTLPSNVVMKSIVLKTNNVGVLRMLLASIESMNATNQSTYIHVTHAGSGTLIKNDITIAVTEGCDIYCFRTPSIGRELSLVAEREKVLIHEFRHFQQLLDELAGLEANSIYTPKVPVAFVEPKKSKTSKAKKATTTESTNSNTTTRSTATETTIAQS